MYRSYGLIYGLIIATAASLTYAQDGTEPKDWSALKDWNDRTNDQYYEDLSRRIDESSRNDWNDPSQEATREMPRLELSESHDAYTDMYVAEQRNRMILNSIGVVLGFLLGQGLLHVIQVKLKIHRGYFWLVVGGVIVLMAINGYRNRANREGQPSDYAPMHIQ